MEQTRIVKEMRAADIQRGRATEFVRPRYMAWENVPGAFSSGTPKGEDFRIVLEEILRICFDSVHVPGPYTGRWEPAGRILLGDTFSLAWRCLDAQLCEASHNCAYVQNGIMKRNTPQRCKNRQFTE